MVKMLMILSGPNPFTPFEIVFLEPEVMPDPATLLSAIKIHRPHYLDNDLQFAFSKPGNRAVIFTVVTRYRFRRFSGDMQRQIYWWKAPDLPEMETLRALDELDGILIDAQLTDEKLISWQDRFAEQAGDMIPVSFADITLQRRWLNLTAVDDYYSAMMNGPNLDY